MVAATPNRQADARDVLQQFVKAFTNLKLYPIEHAHCQASLGHFSSRLQRFLRRHEVLRLAVSQQSLLCEGEPVYESEERSGNLAFRLYVDGLRELTIREGATAKEAEALAIVFYRVVVDPALDCTNLLWEADLAHVEYQALNALAEAWEQQDFLSEESLDLLKSMNDDVEDTASRLNSGALSFELTDGAGEASESLEHLRGGNVQEEDEYLGIDEGAIERFRDDVLSWGPERLLTQTIAAALDGLAQEPELLTPSSVSWLLQESVDLAIRSNDMESLAKLLDRYQGELQLADEDEEEVFEFVFHNLRKEESAVRVVDLAVNGALGGPAAFFRIAAHFGEDQVRLLARALVSLHAVKDWRDALLEHLGPLVPSQPQVLSYLFETEDEELGLELLSLGKKHLSQAAFTDLLKLAMVHPAAGVQEAAQQAWLTQTPEGRRLHLVEWLVDPDRARRLEALSELLKAGERGVFEKLKEIVSSGDFLKRDAEERRAFLSALRLLGGTASIAFLQDQTKRTTRIFNRAAVKELREMAVEELSRLKKDGTRRIERPS